jgi:hypothetical protein
LPINSNMSLDTTTLGALGKQPKNVNFLSGIKFKFQIRKLPNTVYFCQAANIPAVNLSVSQTPTPMGINLQHAGNKLTFGDLNITFMIDENMGNYIEIFNWIIGLGHPDSLDEYAKMKFGDQSALSQFGGLFSDCVLTVLDSDSNANLNIYYRNAFPYSLSEVTLQSTSDDTDYKQCTVSFKYETFEVRPVI